MSEIKWSEVEPTATNTMSKQRRNRPNKTERLQRIADELREEYQYEFTVEWRGNSWWGVPDTPRHFNDNGQFLGADFEQAKHTLETLLG